jgi:hypothetical protein
MRRVLLTSELLVRNKGDVTNGSTRSPSASRIGAGHPNVICLKKFYDTSSMWGVIT